METATNNLSPEQRAELKAGFKAELRAEILAEEQAKSQLREREIETYKSLVNNVVDDSFPVLEALAVQLRCVKEDIRGAFATIITMKQELYGTKGGQQSHTFMNELGDRRIRIGYNVLDKYDDTAEAGVSIVKEYVQSLAQDDKSQQLVDIVLDLLSKDSKGTLKASRVLKLRKYADKSGNVRFMEGVKIIMDAYTPAESKSYIKSEYKDGDGEWHLLPSGLTES